MMFVIYDQLTAKALMAQWKDEWIAKECCDELNWNTEQHRRCKSKTGIPQTTYTRYVVRRAEA